MIYILGAGGHGSVVADILTLKGEDYRFLDDSLPSCYPLRTVFALEENPCIIAIGDNKKRCNIYRWLVYDLATVVHPSSIISNSAVGKGAVICAGAIIQPESRIGHNVIINTGAQVDHHCVIGDHAHIAPNATLCGNVEVGEGALVGAGAVVLPGAKVPAWTTVKAGSVYAPAGRE